MSTSFSRSLPAFAVLVALFVGCGGGGGVIPRGKVTKGGQPLKVSEKGMVQVRLFPAEGTVETTYSGQVAADGTFQVKGSDGKAIPAGKYKIAVFQLDPYPTTDLLKGQFDEKKTTIVRDVSGSQEIVIDLDKP